MQINQAIYRPKEKVILLQHTDNAGRAGVTVIDPESLDVKQADALTTFLALCLTRLPMEPEKPPMTEIEQEIAELEYRLEHLKAELGGAAAQLKI
ncbi:MAG TPA: hypothetical protein VMZ27_18235 [Candidatus Saccharimonadales bacterium]|nr:hypothetical protein [Candidatus Saccharimonadales bacterium]